MNRLLTFLFLGSLTLSASAQDAVSESDAPVAEETAGEAPISTPPTAADVLSEEVIPKAFANTRYQATWSSNPFLRKTVVSNNPTIDWSNDWALAGMYKSTTGKITISLQNKQTAEFKRVTSDADANSEFKLISANFNRNRTEASVDLEKDGKKATLKYDDNLTSRPVTVSNTFKAPTGGQPGAAQGNPNLRTPQPGQAGQLPGQLGQPVNVTAPRGTIQPGGIQPGLQPGAVPTAGQPATAPTISRRRQLIPAPVAPPAAQPQ